MAIGKKGRSGKEKTRMSNTNRKNCLTNIGNIEALIFHSMLSVLLLVFEKIAALTSFVQYKYWYNFSSSRDE